MRTATSTRSCTRLIAVASGRQEAFVRGLGADEFIDYTRVAPEALLSGLDLVVDFVGGPDSGRFLQTVSATQVRSNGQQLATLGGLLNDATVRVAIDRQYPLPDARAAHERAAAGHMAGKLVLTVR